MRSFASVLLDTFTSFYSVMLIDEPEAFLHPPQAKILGQMLAENNPNNRQLFLATHSQELLQGLLDAGQNVIVIRMNRHDNVNCVSVLHNTEIEQMWRNPILRYSNILNGLFHDKVIVCESDYDCLFYQAVMTAMCEKEETDIPNVLFVHCGGKSRMKDVIKALKSVNVPVVAICDFDVLNSSQILKEIIVSFGLEWNDLYTAGMKEVYDTMNSRPNSWDGIKKIGKAGFWGSVPKAYENVEAICMKAGLFIVPVGEMEDFDKTINLQKKEWVYSVLESYDLANEIKLEGVRQFLKGVLEF